MEQIKTFYNKIPSLIKSFLLKAFLIFIAWQLLYRIVLEPKRIPDRSLTNITAFATSELISVFYDHVSVVYAESNAVQSAVISINGSRILGIGDPCNALEIFVLYIAFLFCFPGTARRRWLFIAGGLPYIFIINTIRCALLVWLNITHKGWVDISHHYIFTTVVYMLVFYLWVLYSKQGYDVSRRVVFILSLVLVVILSWLNVNYFGQARSNRFSYPVNQFIHGLAFGVTWVIGYLNWRANDKWVQLLWTVLYGLACCVFAVLAISFYYTHSISLRVNAAIIRNTFAGPLPFLVFYLFTQIARKIYGAEVFSKPRAGQ